MWNDFDMWDRYTVTVGGGRGCFLTAIRRVPIVFPASFCLSYSHSVGQKFIPRQTECQQKIIHCTLKNRMENPSWLASPVILKYFKILIFYSFPPHLWAPAPKWRRIRCGCDRFFASFLRTPPPPQGRCTIQKAPCSVQPNLKFRISKCCIIKVECEVLVSE